MRWKKLFTPVENLDADSVRQYMKEHREGTFTLLDVRQPAEYEKLHLPGAKLIPLPELTDRLEELNLDEPLIVYCAIGGRSRAAGQLLAGKGFNEVYNLKGGINAWQDRTATGPVEMGEVHLTGEETEKEIILFIYSMEAGLERFYLQAAEAITDVKVADMLKKLAGIETGHKERVLNLYAALDPGTFDRSSFEALTSSALMEGGFDIDTFLRENRKSMQTVSGVLDIAMMLETQALDLYLRVAQDTEENSGQAVLYNIAEEEKAHLTALGRLLEERIE